MKKKRKLSSQLWLKRQEKDPYVTKAKKEGYKSRAAFKLIELNDQFNFLMPGQTIVDLGAAPGGWTQIASQKVKASENMGRVIALDILEMEPIPGADIFQMDFTNHDDFAKFEEYIGKTRIDCVLSDMAPNTTGHKQTDHLRIMTLAELALDFAIQHLSPQGTFIAKIFQGGGNDSFQKKLKIYFSSVKNVKPPSSRKESSELYVVCTGYKELDEKL